jgi:hypothetical protein
MQNDLCENFNDTKIYHHINDCNKYTKIRLLKKHGLII